MTLSPLKHTVGETISRHLPFDETQDQTGFSYISTQQGALHDPAPNMIFAGENVDLRPSHLLGFSLGLQ